MALSEKQVNFRAFTTWLSYLYCILMAFILKLCLVMFLAWEGSKMDWNILLFWLEVVVIPPPFPPPFPQVWCSTSKWHDNLTQILFPPVHMEMLGPIITPQRRGMWAGYQSLVPKPQQCAPVFSLISRNAPLRDLFICHQPSCRLQKRSICTVVAWPLGITMWKM